MPGNLNVLMILGSVRDGRMLDRVSKLVESSIKKHTKLSVGELDPSSHCELNRQPMHFIHDSGAVPSWMKEVNEKIMKADGFILLTSEYNGLMPPAISNFMNTFPPTSYHHRPCGIVTYSMGTTGGMRALMNARGYISELGMLTVPPGICPIPTVHETVNENGVSENSLIHTNLEMLVKNLEWHAHAINEFKNKKPFP